MPAVRFVLTTEELSPWSDPVGWRFVRSMPLQPTQSADAYADLVLSMNPVVYYRMEEWPKGEG